MRTPGITPPELRLFRLADAGVSGPVLRLATGEGERVHPIFWPGFQTPLYVYARGATVPAGGGEITPLWEHGTTCLAVRWHGMVSEFVRFDLERGRDFDIIARTEQGLLAHVFVELVERQDWSDEAVARARLAEAATAVGFRHLDAVDAFQATSGGRREYDRLLLEFTRSL